MMTLDYFADYNGLANRRVGYALITIKTMENKMTEDIQEKSLNHSKIAAGLKLFRQEIKFVAGASKISQIPRFHFSQIVFVGKSNVGKSSLINLICNRKTLARVSHTPGRTQQINFFNVVDKFILVDLPGYGYAKVSLTQKELC
jgi:GTP-binding protein